MGALSDAAAMRHMDVHMEAEEKYAEACLAACGADRLARKLQLEMASRLASDACTPPVRWGPWLYYRRTDEGKQYPVLCRRSAALHSEFVSYSDPSAGFDFTAGKRIEQKLVDYNKEAERFGGYSYEELSEVSPDHRFIAYTMYDKDKDSFTLMVRDLVTGSLCDKPRADRISNISWAMDGKALVYIVTNEERRPYRMIGSNKDDILILEEPDENIFLNIRHTKDFLYITLNVFSDIHSKVYLIKASDPLSQMKLVWEGESQVHCIVEHHRGRLYLFTDAAREGVHVDSHYLMQSDVESSGPKSWKNVFIEEPGVILEDVDFCDTHMALTLRQGRKLRLCAVNLPLTEDINVPAHLSDFHPFDLPLPSDVCQIVSGPNYDYCSSTMRFTISSPVMPDAVVDYNLLNGKWQIVQQQNMLHERTKALYGTAFAANMGRLSSDRADFSSENFEDCAWNELSEYYACEYYDVPSKDGVLVPLTLVYSWKHKQDGNPGLLHGHGAYGEILDKRWRSELKSLLDRGWVIAYADVRISRISLLNFDGVQYYSLKASVFRGGGGYGKKWHQEGSRTKKVNSVCDFVSCGEFLLEKGIIQENKLAGWGYSAGGLLVASAINTRPDLFRAAVLKVPFLDVCNTLLHPILPLTAIDYEEFGFPVDHEEFVAIRKYSPYDNIQRDVPYPAVFVTSSFNTRFGVWEAAKWVAKVREITQYDPERPVILNLTTDVVEESKYLQTKELALETAFLIKMVNNV
ncbi:Protease 2 [Dichanthelium oligosanthes]|uniref:Prolyl endopeptidase-like n=1 Tax=Dichanthelium oligosanthes TaxID=888268 RepID=A0A1E5VZ78_9POAL|nr:Protease 2 [Dichanthelium oligosanthes]